MSYLLGQATKKKAPQSQPIPGREKDMTKNNAGGFAFKADSWMRFERFILLGSEGGSYYVGERKLTEQNVDNVRACITEDGSRAVQMIVEVSEAGRAPKNDPALYALALAASCDNEKTRAVALAMLPRVARIGTHLFTFAAFIDEMRGWGPALRKAVASWYASKGSVEKIGYQLVKYQQRNGWSHRDLMRLSHMRDNSAAVRWALGVGFDERVVARYRGKEKIREDRYPSVNSELPPAIRGFELAKFMGAEMPCHCTTKQPDHKAITTCEDCCGSGLVKGNERDISALIREYGLTREMVSTEFQKSPAVWEALLEKMPVGAMVRTLGRMGSCGLLAPFSQASQTVVSRLHDRDLLRSARVHPISILSALLTYKQGNGQRGGLTWQPVPQVVDALNDAFYLAFEFVEPTNKRFVLGVDVSGSMTLDRFSGIPGLTPNMGAAAMAMLIARTEPQYFIGGFSTYFIHLGITKNDRLDSAMKKAQTNFGGTDTTVAIRHALDHKIPADVFVIISDGETWAGNEHTSQSLNRYRHKTGIDSKLVVINVVANMTRLTDPNDAGSLDVVGFDASVPAVIAQFIGAGNGSVPEQSEDES